MVKATLKVADFDKTIEVTANMAEAMFTVPLKKGKLDIYSEFLDNDEFGVHYLYVKRR